MSFLPTPISGVLGFTLFALNLAFWCIPFYIVGLLKLFIPLKSWRKTCVRWLEALGELWIDGNSLIEKLLHGMEWDIEGMEGLRRRDWYLISSNHQNWVDVFVLQCAFNRRIPFLKFFLKKQLIWVPLFGFAWWALDLPFMERHSREKIAKHPELKGKDLETTRRACQHFSEVPTSLINFLEGTRFTPEKHAAQNSPYNYLLKPKAGGLAFALAAMGETMHKLLDVTIVYPRRDVTFWHLLSGQLEKVIIQVNEQEIPTEFFHGDYLNDEAFRTRFQSWVTELWQQKDQQLTRLTQNN
ncbi:MAG: acyltransferase [Gammaproteobacteria bacterium]|nr:acyltransferase [Gammaproteobacteria bacterium]